MKIRYDPSVDALDIRLLEGKIECESIHLSDQVSLDIGPDGRIVAIEVLDASELVPDLKSKGIELENLMLKESILT